MPQKTVLITGCSSGGIGSALAAEFQLQGLRVFATARDAAKMRDLADKGIETLALDVTSGYSVADAVAHVSKALGTDGSLDYLINNAGIQHVMPFTDTQLDDVRAVFETNFFGVLAVTQAFLPLLINAKGMVASIGSINEVFNPPYQLAYNVSKTAVHAMAKTLRVELEPLGVRFVTVVTGGVTSKLDSNALTAKLPEGSPYAPVKDHIESRDWLEQARYIDAEKYARQVVGDLLKARSKRTLWRGGLAWIAWWLNRIGWEGMLDHFIVKGSELDKVAR